MADTLLSWLLQQADNEAIEAVLFGRGPYAFSPGELAGFKFPYERVMSFTEALPYLGFHFEPTRFATEGMQAVYAWTASWVILIRCYDGRIQPARVPRHPTVCMPQWLGGR